METIQVTITRIRFQSAENGYAIVAARSEDSECTLKGSMPGVRVNEDIEATGVWATDRYGRYFRVDGWKEVMPTSTKGIEAYLASGLIKGIGEKYARDIVRTFGKDTLDILDKDPERLLEVPGIGRKRAASIIESFKEQHEIRDIMIFLKTYDIPNGVAAKIYARYGKESIARLKENPYRLADDILGIGFKKADDVALKLGLPDDSLERVKAGVLFALEDRVSSGHTYSPKDQLVEFAASDDILGIDRAYIPEAIAALELEGKVVNDEDRIYLSPFYHAEAGVASRLAELLKRNGRQDVTLSVGEIERKTGCRYEDRQVDAVETAQREPVMILTGLPGTGKTTVSKAIITALEMQGRKILLAAPTGRAAKRLSEATGRPARTIHRLLEYGRDGFGRNEENPLSCDAILVDESSMIDIILMNSLVKAVPKKGCKLIMVGDIDQLPSVGAGNVLRDLIDSGRIPTVRLTRIYRQALDSQIVVGAHAINAGQFPAQFGKDLVFIEDDDKDSIQSRIVNLVSVTLPQKYGYGHADIQVLSPMKRAYDPIGTTQLNRILQDTLNQNTAMLKRGLDEFRLGDRVMQMKNDYDLDVFNGDTGFITAVDRENDRLTVSFEGDEKTYGRADLGNLSLAYACTVHKSQGSEYPVVILPVHESQFILHERNLLYTAITRAKKLCILVGTRKAMHTMISRQPVTRRFTALDERIKAEVETVR